MGRWRLAASSMGEIQDGFEFYGMIARIGVPVRMDDKITIIEGPPPTFEVVDDSWVLGLNESSVLADVALTRLRTFNGPELVERCHRAWRNQQPIYLEYRTSDGLNQQAPIMAARYIETDEGHLLLLWVRLLREESESELDLGDDDTGDDSSSGAGYPPDNQYPPNRDNPLRPADWSL